MKKILIVFLINYLFLFISLFSQSLQDTSISDISLRTYVENESVALNREVIYVVQLNWEGDLSRYKISEILDPDLTNLSVRGTGSSNKVFTNTSGKEISTKKVTFYFKPLEMGMAYINGVTIRYEDTLLGHEESLLASRISVKIIEPIPDDSASSDWQNMFYIIVLIVFIGSGAYLFIIYNKRKKENAQKELENIVETFEERYIRLLKETINLSGNNYKEKLSDLSHLLLGYLSEKYSKSLINMSSDEIITYFEHLELESNILLKLKDFLSKSDLIRFAGNAISETEFHQFYDSVEWMLEKFKYVKSERED